MVKRSPTRKTLASLAAELGVSRTTVSNAYSRPDQLSTATRERILAAAEHREQAVRAGLGLLRLGGAHGADRLEQACQAALEANVRSWRYVQRWLTTGGPPPASSDGLGEHANLRGPSYYRN